VFEYSINPVFQEETMNVRKFIGVTAALAVLYLCAGSYASAGTFPPLPEGLAAMESDADVAVTKVDVVAWEAPANYFYSFAPVKGRIKTGYIFYPGAFVDPRAYAPPLHEIAKAGYLAVVVKMPDDTAFSGIDRATDVIAQFPKIKKWVIGGHSMGGVAASAYIRNNIDNNYTKKMVGLAIWATYLGNAEFDTINDATIKAVSIYGSNDGLASVGEIEAGKPYMPPKSEYIEIQGGNHTYFGWYDTSPAPLQPGDNPATITREEQQKQVIDATVAFLDKVSKLCPVIGVLGENDPDAAIIRQFRDTVLARSAWGRALTESYYASGSDMAAWLDRNAGMKSAARIMIKSLTPVLKKLVSAEP